MLIKKISLIFFFLISFNSIFSQLDVILNYGSAMHHNWDQLMENTFEEGSRLLDKEFGIGIAYRFFPHQARFGYLPQFEVLYSSDQHNKQNEQNPYEYQSLTFLFSPALQLFPFDLQGDCNCPTFGKQNDFFQKAFYLKVIPGIGTSSLKASYQENILKDQQLFFSVGLGIGMNIALSELVTLTPDISYHYTFLEKWEGISDFHNQLPLSYDDTNGNALRAGIRITFYFN